jgi:hypothetical protein
LAADYGAKTYEVLDVFERLVTPWANGDRRVVTPWVSEISDDNTPIEFSVTITNEGSEVRILLEPQGDEPTVESFRAAAIAYFERLEREFGVSLARFRRVQDLFAPRGMQGPFAIWTSAVFRREGPPTFKAYFNPQARGLGQADALVEEGLCRLGFSRSWASLAATSTRRGPLLDEIKYFALDLHDEEEARVKVYVRHHHASPEDLEIASSAASGYSLGEALEFARAMGGGRSSLDPRATFTCSAFVEGRGAPPTATTLYVPVCAYNEHDGAVRERLLEYLKDSPETAVTYDRIISGYANRPLVEGTGMQSWAALRRLDDEVRMTVYLATEARHVFPAGDVPAGTGDRLAFESADDVLKRASTYGLENHPFVQRLLRDEERASMLWTLVHALAEGEAAFLQALLPSLGDEALRSALQGLPKTASTTLRKLLVGNPAPTKARMESSTVCSKRFAERLNRLVRETDALGVVCALIMLELGARQLLAMIKENDALVRDPIAQRARALSDGERTEDDDDLLALARLIPAESMPVGSVRQGTLHTHRALWSLLNELYVSWLGDDGNDSCVRIKAATPIASSDS